MRCREKRGLVLRVRGARPSRPRITWPGVELLVRSLVGVLGTVVLVSGFGTRVFGFLIVCVEGCGIRRRGKGGRRGVLSLKKVFMTEKISLDIRQRETVVPRRGGGGYNK